MFAKVKERLVISKQTALKFDWEEFNTSQMSWRLGNCIRLKLEIGLHLWRT